MKWTKKELMQILLVLFLFFLSMWIISDTRLFIGLMVYVTCIRYEDRIKKEWDGLKIEDNNDNN